MHNLIKNKWHFLNLLLFVIPVGVGIYVGMTFGNWWAASIPILFGSVFGILYFIAVWLSHTAIQKMQAKLIERKMQSYGVDPELSKMMAEAFSEFPRKPEK